MLHCPGHSPGSVVFVNAAQRFVLVGDVLFQGSIGRTDFAYGDHDALISAIKTKLLPLGDDYVVHLRPRADEHHRRGAAEQSVPRLRARSVARRRLMFTPLQRRCVRAHRDRLRAAVGRHHHGARQAAALIESRRLLPAATPETLPEAL